MTFAEKSAWVMIVALVLAGYFYAQAVIAASQALGVIVLCGIWNYAVRSDGNLLFHILVLGMVASQVLEYAVSIFFYRRGV